MVNSGCLREHVHAVFLCVLYTWRWKRQWWCLLTQNNSSVNLTQKNWSVKLTQKNSQVKLTQKNSRVKLTQNNWSVKLTQKNWSVKLTQKNSSVKLTQKNSKHPSPSFVWGVELMLVAFDGLKHSVLGDHPSTVTHAMKRSYSVSCWTNDKCHRLVSLHTPSTELYIVSYIITCPNLSPSAGLGCEAYIGITNVLNLFCFLFSPVLHCLTAGRGWQSSLLNSYSLCSMPLVWDKHMMT